VSASQTPQGSQVQVVIVRVRDKNKINWRKVAERYSRFSEPRDVVTECPTEDRIGKNIDATQPEKNCCMVDESQRMQNN